MLICSSIEIMHRPIEALCSPTMQSVPTASLRDGGIVP